MRTEVSRLQRRLGTTTVYVTHDQTEAMTLGDRVAVMRAGRLQQVGSPQELYDNPVNLFVAGFIGSPAMNFLPASYENGRLHSALGDVPVHDEVRRAIEGGPGRDVIMGIRPEHFEDASLVGEDKRDGGAVFREKVDLVESMGSDKFVFFTVSGGRATSRELEELAADAGSEDTPLAGDQLVARFDAGSTAARGQQVDVWTDAGRVHVFDPSSGENLSLRRSSSRAA